MKHKRANRRGAPVVTYGIVDPDYARIYSIIRCTAWQYGYAACMHGSFTRDLDVVLVPWTEHAVPFDHLMRALAWRTGLILKGEAPVQKLHGRLAWSLLFPEQDPRWVDVSAMPRVLPAPSEDAGGAGV